MDLKQAKGLSVLEKGSFTRVLSVRHLMLNVSLALTKVSRIIESLHSGIATVR